MYDFDRKVDRHGTWSVQWDGIEDRFGVSDLLPFTISDMDFASPPEVLAALRERIDHGVFGYTDWRLGAFREAIRHWYASRHDTAIDVDALVYAPSVLNQLSQLLRMWTGPGDGVVVHTPTYDGFRKAVTGLGRELRGVPVGDMAALERELARPDSRMLLLCSPHNPTGRVWTEEELTAFARLAERHGVAVVSDEIHADLTAEGHRHIPWARIAEPGRGRRWALITSGTKAFNFPALSGSYGLLGDPDERTAFVRRMETGEGLASPAVLSLTAHIAAYRQGAPWLDALRGYVAGTMESLGERLAEGLPGVVWEPPQAGYLAWIDLRPLGIDEARLQEELVAVEKVAIMPGGVYGTPGFVRLNVGCPREKAERGADALIRAANRLRTG
ncbi:MULTISPECIES: MalY/PatB family protein [unclassified Streptomyces]|uniref:MalY/PatB family protein n=1 Tax=unclassified Streptomyces TaxID=2593676 RepID=UPI001660248F|nr:MULTISPECIES: MalY/PatB family protein [unclassified Streptomyces]MBD0712033.1 transcriptional regulator [Streptomyces sp. CBMA291]MBD0717982.1 transcriptional regulator [Streptomyces sp. CBMA370]